MHIYFMGICGTAMGNAALLMQAQGHQVSGADSGVYPPMSDVLAQAGIQVMEGFDSERLAALAPDQVVIGNAMSRGNPEVEWLLEQDRVPFVSLPALLSDTLLAGRMPIVIAGTHGKTTTSALTAFLLDRAGADPGWLIGGVPRDLPTGSRLGAGDPFVIEGDEYDSAFFDKRSKFIHYRPRIAVLNNLEFDHADIFRDLEDVQRSFSHFLRILPASGYALINGDDENLKPLLPVGWTQILRVGCGPQNDLRLTGFEDSAGGARFELHWQGQFWQCVEWSMHGLFNARNAAMAALATALALKCAPLDLDLSALADFRGVRRRQDTLYTGQKFTVVEDFAHHPTAVSATIEALRAAYPRRRMLLCFEPRSNTAATARFQHEFSEALQGADEVLLGVVYRGEQIPPERRLDTTAMAKRLREHGCRAASFVDNDELYTELCERLKRAEIPSLVIFLTNGSFDGLPKKTASWLADG
jgi:UDP-N-acetylmuramate: L-alanyl-gamma-D-glutamyl-meso-diaminopimelate ligase